MSNKREIEFSGGQAEPGKAPRSLRILIADDERDAVLTLMMLLREEGHDARGVYSGKQALALLRDFEPDVALLDIALPELSGWEVARQIRERKGDRPLLIALSGIYKSPTDKFLSESVGFDHHLLKPYDPKVLLALIAPLTQPKLGG